MKSIKVVLFFLLTCLVHGTGVAKTSYVSDNLVITLRTGPGNQYQVQKSLSSGNSLEVLKTDEDAGWTKVATKDGTEGWVLSRYLVGRPIHKVRLVAAEKRLERYQSENASLKDQLQKLQQDKNELEKEWKDLSSDSTKMNKELSRVRQISSQPLKISEENKTLKTQSIALENEVKMLAQENQALKDRTNRDWFIAGAAVLVFGLIVGLIIPKIRWSKKTGWGDSL